MTSTAKIKPQGASLLSSQQVEFVKGAPASSGKSNLLKHLYGDRLTRNEAIFAKCCDCSGYYIDGRLDCQTVDCPLYPFMPYRGKK